MIYFLTLQDFFFLENKSTPLQLPPPPQLPPTPPPHPSPTCQTRRHWRRRCRRTNVPGMVDRPWSPHSPPPLSPGSPSPQPAANAGGGGAPQAHQGIFMVIIFSGVVNYSWSCTCGNVRRNRPTGLVLQVNDCIIIYYILLFTI